MLNEWSAALNSNIFLHFSYFKMITDYVVGVPNDLHTAGSVSALTIIWMIVHSN